MSDETSFGLDALRTVLETLQNGRKRVVAMLGHMNGGQADGDADGIPGVTEGQRAEWMQHVGFVSLPSEADPVKKLAAKVVSIVANGFDYVIASRDQRGMELAGALRPGESCMYAGGKDGKGQARVLCKDDGSIHLYTRAGNDPDGAGMVVQVDATNDAIRLLNSSGMGIIIDANGITLTTGAAALTLKTSGAISLIATGMCQVDGTAICLGSIAVPIVNGVCVGPAGLVAVCSTKVLAALA